MQQSNHENISLFVYVDIIRTHYLTIEKVSTVSGHTTSLVCIICTYVRLYVYYISMIYLGMDTVHEINATDTRILRRAP